MVEGPGATRNGQKVQAAVGKSVINIYMDPMFLIGSTEPVDCCQLYTNKLQGCILEEAFTIGKELFLIFSNSIPEISDNFDNFDNNCENGKYETNYTLALRIHFGMNGTLMISKNGREPSVPKWRKSETPTMRIALGSLNLNHRKSPVIDTYFHKAIVPNKNDAQNFVDLTDVNDNHTSCTNDIIQTSNKVTNIPIEFIIEIRRATHSFTTSATSARAKLSRLSSSDVCGPVFSHDDVFQNFTKAIHDDQKKQSETIIADAILNQNLFPGIGNIIKVESLHRAKIDPRRFLSSFSNYELKLLIEHCRDFSMHWLKFNRTPIKYVYNQTVCGTCNNMSVKMQKMGGNKKNQMKDSTQIDDGKITSSVASLKRVTFWCIHCQPMQPQNQIKKSNPTNTTTQPEILKSGSPEYKTKRPSQIDNSNHVSKGHVFNPYKKYKNTNSTGITKVHNPYKKNLMTPSNSISDVMPSSICPIHGSSAILLRRVRKEGPNKLRLFYSCKNQKCSFFIWADSHFPFCHCHGNVSINNKKTISNTKGKKKAILRVSKTERSGGKWFLCCANGQENGPSKNHDGKWTNTGCGYFEWATGQLLEPIKKHITPLL